MKIGFVIANLFKKEMWKNKKHAAINGWLLFLLPLGDDMHHIVKSSFGASGFQTSVPQNWVGRFT